MNLGGTISDHPARGEKGALTTIMKRIGSVPGDEGERIFYHKTKETED
ncbi:hypothetical protein [Syntrophorhabdus aromaticivorans]|jgi:hypothetical protein|uniref:Uncharacterized protein n=1 Tax=Syntrophorhabdus aromaticivorans TaxID=328301 RepID=A0A971M3Q8_9BACT|nr:hypothetical protein [Syntrophorhabdus aromaticivorans]NLW35397.1 hypothetical protein [Syntrophorhabdus aromaticivorans]